jgi:dTDP-4-amino-4,6-dideoxygalactose transaminase
LRPRVEVADTLAVCDALAPRALSLPLHPGLTVADVDRVVDALAGGLSLQTAATAPTVAEARQRIPA